MSIPSANRAPTASSCWSPLRLAWFLAFSLLAACGIFAADESDQPPLTAQELTQGYRDGRILVKLREGATAATLGRRQQMESAFGINQRQVFKHLDRQQLLQFDGRKSVKEIVKQLRASGEYEFVEPDHVVHALVTPGDTRFGEQWSLNNTGQSNGTAGADIRAVSAWDNLTNTTPIIVAVLDSGIRLTHEDLVPNLWTNPSPSATYGGKDLHGINATVATSDANSGTPNDDNGHGTHVSGTIGASGNNGKGIVGVAWNTQIMSLKFLNASGDGTLSGELACINYAIAHGAKVLNGSFGSNTYSASEYSALQAAQAAGVIVVVAAGNDSLSVESALSYPAGYQLDNIVAVASTTRTDTLSIFSDFSSGLVDLAAPGSEILSTYNASDSSYKILSGTSMATPHVAGAVALLRARFPSDTYRQTINRLLRATTSLPALSGKVQSGGRLNLANALSSTNNLPFNDDFASRALLTGSNVRVRSSNVGATHESNEPSHAGIAGTRSLWWTWTAPTTTQVSFDTSGSNFDTTVAVYTGNQLSSLSVAGFNDDAPGTTTSRVTIGVTAGTVYQVAIDGKNGASGQIALRVGAIPANDDFTSATVLSGTSFKVTGSTVNASVESAERDPTTNSGGHSVWYRWVAPSAGRVQLSAFSLQDDMIAAVYTGSALPSLTLVASNDDSASSNLNSLLSFTAAAGQTYYFSVDNTEAAGGEFILSLADSLWQFPAGDEITSSPAVGPDGTAYFGSADSRFYAVNPDGTKKWQANTGAAVTLSSPSIGSDGTIFVGADDFYLYAFDGSMGSSKWKYLATSAISSSPAIAPDGTVYFRDDTTLYALAPGASSATKKWSVAIGGPTYGSPSVGTDGTIYVGTTGGTLYAISPSGIQNWKFTADGDIYTTPAIARDGTIYFATLNGAFYAVNASGTLKWVWKTPDGSSITSSPAIGADGTLYFAGYDHKLHAISSAGVEKWSYTAGDEIRASSPAIAANGIIYFGAYDGMVYAVNPSGTLVRTYPTAQLVRSSPAIANNRLYFTSSDSKLYTFALAENAAISAWPMYHQGAAHLGRPSTSPVIDVTALTNAQTVKPGESLTLNATAASSLALTYQWYKDGVAIPGATSSAYSISSADASAAGSYTLKTTSSAGSITVEVSVLVLDNIGGRLANLSARAAAGPDNQTLIVGFVIGGSAKTVLLRGIGPALGAFGVSGVISDPRISLYSGSDRIDTNDNWGGGSGLSNAFASVGAFELDPLGKDAALLKTLDASAYTAQITGGSGGVALAEVYDTAPASTTGRVKNLSARAQVGAGGNILIAGFVIQGSAPKQVLIRAVGPTLASASFGVVGALTAPVLTLFNNSTVIATNSTWGGTTKLKDAFTAVGAFALPADSADAAILVNLAPGNYTAQVSGVNDSTGVAIVEVYEMP